MFSMARTAYALDDGVYQVDARVLRANSDDASVADASIEEPLTLVVADGKSYLDARIKPVTTSGLTGYLGFLAYFPMQHGASLPKNAEPTAILPQGYYDVSDDFNMASQGVDAAMRGMRYPRTVAFEVDPAYSQIWIQVYVPLVEGLSAGGGTQRARLIVDYGSARAVTDAAQAEGARSAVAAAEAGASTGRQLLYDRVYQASMQLLQSSAYTESSLSQLRSARDAAQAVCENAAATGRDSMNAMLALVDAQQRLQKRSANSGSTGKKGTSGGKSSGASEKRSSGGTSKTPKASKAATREKLDFAKLPDGTYTLYGEMIKADRKSQSVSDGAIDHNVRLRVKNGTYTIELTFKVMEMSGKTGALGNLWYFKSGYKKDASGAPTGGYAAARTLTRFSVEGESYPKKVSFPLISEARSDGWVPLRMYVPIIESISKGAGVQEAYLKLDRNSVVSGEQQVATAGRSRGASTAAEVSGSDGESSDAPGSGSSTLNALLGDAGGKDDGAAGANDTSSKASPAKGASAASTGAQQVSPSQSAATGDQEPPLKRYIGLIIGIPALIICLYCAYVLFTRRGQLQVFRRSRS